MSSRRARWSRSTYTSGIGKSSGPENRTKIACPAEKKAEAQASSLAALPRVHNIPLPARSYLLLAFPSLLAQRWISPFSYILTFDSLCAQCSTTSVVQQSVLYVRGMRVIRIYTAPPVPLLFPVYLAKLDKNYQNVLLHVYRSFSWAMRSACVWFVSLDEKRHV